MMMMTASEMLATMATLTEDGRADIDIEKEQKKDRPGLRFRANSSNTCQSF